jgi:glycogen operon protein
VGRGGLDGSRCWATDRGPDDLALRRSATAPPGCPRRWWSSDAFDWGGDRRLDHPWRKTVIYELHVKGFTKRHPEIPEELRGTYAGLATPPHRTISRRWVTAVELLPVHESADDAFLEERYLRNYWGYSTLGYFAPEQRYASRAARAAGRRVQGDGQGPARRRHRGDPRRGLQPHLRGQPPGPHAVLEGIDNASYYWLMPEPRYYLDFTGTRQQPERLQPETGAADRRFAALLGRRDARRRLPLRPGRTLGRGRAGEFDRDAPLSRSSTRTGAVAVQADRRALGLGLGGYQWGNFPAPWREWNGKYRDAIRRYWKGDDNLAGEIGYRLSGSADCTRASAAAPGQHQLRHRPRRLHPARPGHLRHKHNEANGEWNKDGADDNQSLEPRRRGETDDPRVIDLRERQQAQPAGHLCSAQGVPMLLAGDEMGRTQGGNNNAYCQDNEISWVDWNLDRPAPQLLEFTRG